MSNGADNASKGEVKLADLRRTVEALVFASGEPVSVVDMMKVMGISDSSARRAVESVLFELAREFPVGGARGFELVELGGGWVFRTNGLAEEAVKAMFELPVEVGRISPAAMECLAIVAYLQPVTRPQISEIRGVDSDSPIRGLLDRELIVEVGRAQNKGGAILYATTQRFEVMFGLSDLQELPPLEDFALAEDAKGELRRRLGLLTIPE